MPPSNRQIKSSKFTRGEKCLFVHLIITFAMIMLMTLVYFVHLCIVKHTRNDILKIYRRTDNSLSGLDVSDFESIGVIYLNVTPPPVRVACNTLLLRERWSLAPAQCTSMRDDPDMSPYLLHWKIKYKISGKYLHSNIKRTLTHSRFNRGDYYNNIGLFEHAKPIYNDVYYVAGLMTEPGDGFRNSVTKRHNPIVFWKQFTKQKVIEKLTITQIETQYWFHNMTAPNNIVIDKEMLREKAKEMAIVNWELGFSNQGDISHANVFRVHPIPTDKCSTYASPIVEQLRSYEFCINFDHNGPTAG